MKKAFTLEGCVEAVLVTAAGAKTSTPTLKIEVVIGHGIVGDRHAGERVVDVREDELRAFGMSKGTPIANHRQFSAVSNDELDRIRQLMNLLSSIPYGCLGENLVVSGIPKFTKLPTGTILFFKGRNGEQRAAVLVVWKENGPCKVPGEEIERVLDLPGIARQFPTAAVGRRGIVGSVYASGEIHRGDTVIVQVPAQRIYEPP